jgi:adenylate kinase
MPPKRLWANSGKIRLAAFRARREIIRVESINIALLGTSGAGKGTHAHRLCAQFDLEHVSTGDLLRDNMERGTFYGLAARNYMDRGELVPDEVVDGIIEERIKAAPAMEGLLLDAFPCRREQALFLEETLHKNGRSLLGVIYLHVSEDEVVRRLTGRLLCHECHEPFHKESKPPAQPGVCDFCGGNVAPRPDDTETLAHKRFRIFQRNIGPTLEFYQSRGQLHIIDASQPARVVQDRLCLLIEAAEFGAATPSTMEELRRVQATRSAPLRARTGALNLLFLGAPGSGKGTQADSLAEELGLLHIASGDLFRENLKNGTELGKLARTYMNRGELVPDDITEAMIEERLAHADAANGFILDGFPRTLPQAEAFTEILAKLHRPISGAIYIRVSDEALIRRLSGRWICKECQTPFHQLYKRPRVEGICDKCGGILYQREDDKTETVKARLRAFHRQTEPLIAFYMHSGLLQVVEGEGHVNEVNDRIAIATREIPSSAIVRELEPVSL